MNKTWKIESDRLSRVYEAVAVIRDRVSLIQG